MAKSSEFREYENGVADVLASIVGEAGTARRNVRLPSRSGGRSRQIDVLVEGNVFGLAGARMIVDCKRWNKPIDAPDVEQFIGMIDDVGADMGMLVSALGASDGAMKRAQSARGVRVKALSTNELNGWRPVGTVSKEVEIPASEVTGVAKALREKGLRVMVREVTDKLARIEVFRHHGTTTPPGEVQHKQHALTERTLEKLGVSYRGISNGVSVGGGTPYHRWLPVTLSGNRVELKVLASNEFEAREQLRSVAESFNIPTELLDVERPEGWPLTPGFPF